MGLDDDYIGIDLILPHFHALASSDVWQTARTTATKFHVMVPGSSVGSPKPLSHPTLCACRLGTNQTTRLPPAFPVE